MVMEGGIGPAGGQSSFVDLPRAFGENCRDFLAGQMDGTPDSTARCSAVQLFGVFGGFYDVSEWL